jgi:hypothetical protein
VFAVLMVRTLATSVQVASMLGENDFYIKLAVDVERRILAGGGYFHADGEGELLADCSRQADIWGASWSPYTKEILYESMVNLRPRQNRSTQILDPAVRSPVKAVIDQLLGGV